MSSEKSKILPLEGGTLSPLIFGVVIKGKSADKTVIYPVRGGNANLVENKIDSLNIQSEKPVLNRLESRIIKEKPDFVVVDTTDQEKPIFEHFEKFDQVKVIGINPIAVFEKTYWVDWRSCMYSHLKEKIVNRQIELPFNLKLREELGSLHYHMINDRLLVDSKEIVKARIGRFPDLADALALTQVVPRQIEPMYKS